MSGWPPVDEMRLPTHRLITDGVVRRVMDGGSSFVDGWLGFRRLARTLQATKKQTLRKPFFGAVDLGYRVIVVGELSARPTR